jgi:hypothetical protein
MTLQQIRKCLQRLSLKEKLEISLGFRPQSEASNVTEEYFITSSRTSLAPFRMPIMTGKKIFPCYTIYTKDIK